MIIISIIKIIIIIILLMCVTKMPFILTVVREKLYFSLSDTPAAKTSAFQP